MPWSSAGTTSGRGTWRPRRQSSYTQDSSRKKWHTSEKMAALSGTRAKYHTSFCRENGFSANCSWKRDKLFYGNWWGWPKTQGSRKANYTVLSGRSVWFSLKMTHLPSPHKESWARIKRHSGEKWLFKRCSFQLNYSPNSERRTGRWPPLRRCRCWLRYQIPPRFAAAAVVHTTPHCRDLPVCGILSTSMDRTRRTWTRGFACHTGPGAATVGSILEGWAPRPPPAASAVILWGKAMSAAARGVGCPRPFWRRRSHHRDDRWLKRPALDGQLRKRLGSGKGKDFITLCARQCLRLKRLMTSAKEGESKINNNQKSFYGTQNRESVVKRAIPPQ